MSLYSQEVPSEVLKTKESLFLKALQTAVTAIGFDDVRQLTVSASFRQSFFAPSQKDTLVAKKPARAVVFKIY
jgi:hypothetical protein